MESALDLKQNEWCHELNDGLGPLLDKLLLVNPKFAAVTEIAELGDENFEPRDHQRPPGYAATTRVHTGRRCAPLLNDSGATCSCITEEQVVLIINHPENA